MSQCLVEDRLEIIAVELVDGGFVGITLSDRTALLLSAREILMLRLPTYEVLDTEEVTALTPVVWTEGLRA